MDDAMHFLHQWLLRAALARFNGREVGTEGGGFFIAFGKASEAAAAAVTAQRVLAAHPWPDSAVVRVRAHEQRRNLYRLIRVGGDDVRSKRESVGPSSRSGRFSYLCASAQLGRDGVAA